MGGDDGGGGGGGGGVCVWGGGGGINMYMDFKSRTRDEIAVFSTYMT